ncbi:MAG TPA: hypothetical protein VMH39_05955, partial [Gemmatimonadaceae bacterium]|nr:hypothetical protein [Gemmatimonadaceae bacterium]
MLTLPLLVARLLLTSFQPRLTLPGITPAESVTVVDSARAAVSNFNWIWRFYWEATQTIAAPAVGGPLIGDTIGLNPPPQAIIGLAAKIHNHSRIQLLHCHIGIARGFTQPGVNIIESGSGSRAVCPFWFFPSGTPPYDERL